MHLKHGHYSHLVGICGFEARSGRHHALGITLEEIKAALIEERSVDATPHGPWSTITFVGRLRGSGVIAALVLDGATTGEAFLAYAEQMLAPR